MTCSRHGRRRWAPIASIALAVTLVNPPPIAADAAQDEGQDADVKAAFLYNFVKFTEWPALPSGALIAMCVVGDEAIAAALAKTVRGHDINTHPLEVWRPQDTTTWRLCHVLFIAAGEIRRSTAGLTAMRPLPVLTVSDAKGFSEGSGIIELYIEHGRFRFAINVDAVERSRLHLSSRLLGLAKVIHDAHGP